MPWTSLAYTMRLMPAQDGIESCSIDMHLTVSE